MVSLVPKILLVRLGVVILLILAKGGGKIRNVVAHFAEHLRCHKLAMSIFLASLLCAGHGIPLGGSDGVDLRI